MALDLELEYNRMSAIIHIGVFVFVCAISHTRVHAI